MRGFLRPNPQALPFYITYRIKYRENGAVKTVVVTTLARNTVEGLAKALNAAKIPLECVVNAKVVKAEPPEAHDKEGVE